MTRLHFEPSVDGVNQSLQVVHQQHRQAQAAQQAHTSLTVSASVHNVKDCQTLLTRICVLKGPAEALREFQRIAQIGNFSQDELNLLRQCTTGQYKGSPAGPAVHSGVTPPGSDSRVTTAAPSPSREAPSDPSKTSNAADRSVASAQAPYPSLVSLQQQVNVLGKQLAAVSPDSPEYSELKAKYQETAGKLIRGSAKEDFSIESVLRTVYSGNPANHDATVDKAHQIALTYKGYPAAQEAITTALNRVLTESPEQRATGVALNRFHQAGTKLAQLVAEYATTGKVPPGYKAAIQEYNQSRSGVMGCLSKEFGHALKGHREMDFSSVTNDYAQSLIERYDGDDGFGQLVVSARIVQLVKNTRGPRPDLTVTSKMGVLGENLPVGTNAVIKQTVMDDPSVKALVSQYVNDAAGQVQSAYDGAVVAYQPDSDSFRRDLYVPPATAAVDKLCELTDPILHPEINADITARIINRLVSTSGDGSGTLDQVIADISYQGKHTSELCVDEVVPGSGLAADSRAEMPDRQHIITSLSLMADRAAADSVPSGDDSHSMTWSSSDARTAVYGLGRDVVKNMMGPQNIRQDFNLGLRKAVAGEGGVERTYKDAATGQSYSITYAGGATLGLEVARQEIRLDQNPNAPLSSYAEPSRGQLSQQTLEALQLGIQDFKSASETLFQDSHRKMGPLEQTQLGLGRLMPEDQATSGLVYVIEQAQKGDVRGYASALSGFVSGKMSLDQRGYELKRIDDAVDLYGTPATTWNPRLTSDTSVDAKSSLSGQAGYVGVQGARDSMMGDEPLLTMVAGSDRTNASATEKATSAMLNWQQRIGVMPPAYLGSMPLPPALQWGGDGLEHFYQGKFLDYKYGEGLGRLGHHQAATYVSFGGVGAAQLWFTDYLYHNAKFPPDQQWRKDALLVVVGGFAGIKSYQAATVGAYEGSKALGKLTAQLPSSIRDLIDRGGKIGNVEEFFRKHSEFVRTAGWKSVGAFGLLHADAFIWDASRVYYSVKDVTEGKPLDQRNFWTALGNLSCDWATSYGEIKAAYGLFKYPSSQMDGIWREGVAKGLRKIPAAEAEKAGKLFTGRAAKYGLIVAKGPGWVFDGAHAVTNSLLKSGLTKLGVKVGEKGVLADLPGPGTLAAIVWTGDDLVNWIGNEKEAHKLDGAINQDFLTGCGINAPGAAVLSDNGLSAAGWTDWLQMNSLTVGFRNAFLALGGDPTDFVAYMNRLSPDQIALLRDGLESAKTVGDKLPRSAQDDYWTLPCNPFDPAQRKFNPNLSYDFDKGRWVDKHLQMYYAGGSEGGGSWVSQTTAGSQLSLSYQPASHKLSYLEPGGYFADGPITAPKSASGIATWLIGVGIPLPKPTPAPVTPKPTAPVGPTGPLTYTVKAGDSLWGLANNDPGLVRWLYDHNLWLSPESRTSEQGPSILSPGDLLIVPKGFGAAA
ncbi:LysM peptidoglycan-binding domain-containing protein [Roseateles sp. NT4]|uniref:LysM peptidoglycan-binding domain-containing protein n=1 Tax=Roseateles sp. NT4 TaxID=3453715 RepID=UPI003EE9175E